MKYMSLSSATATLKRFFADYPDSNTVTLEQIFISAKRKLDQPDINKAWVANKLTHLKHYGLAEPVYVYEPRKMLSAVALTYEGRKLIGRTNSITQLPPSPAQGQLDIETVISGLVQEPKVRRIVTLESIAQDIKEFEKLNPSIQLSLVVDVNKRDKSL